MTKELTVIKEFQELIPPLSEMEFAQLERNILSVNRILNPIIIWNDTIIDGHNRYAIYEKNKVDHTIEFTTEELNFDSKEDAILWIVNNQFGRRNLTKRQIEYCRGKQYEVEKKKITNQLGKNQHTKDEGQNDPLPKDFEQSTAKAMEKQHHVSASTIKRDARFTRVVDAVGEVSPEAKQMILFCKAKVSKKDLIELDGSPPEIIEAAARAIANNSYTPTKAEPETNDGSTATTDTKNADAQNDSSNNNQNAHDAILTCLGTAADIFAQIDTYIAKDLSVSENKEILRCLHTLTERIGETIGKFSVMQQESLDAEN